MAFTLLTIYFLVLLSLFDVLLIPGAFGHGTWWLMTALLAKTAASMGMASLSLVCRRRWPVAVVVVVLVIWIVANGIYYHATGLYITYDVLTMAGGLAGFTSSVVSYLKWDVWLLIAVALLIVPLQKMMRPDPSWRKMGRVWIAVICCSVAGCFCHYLHNQKYSSEGDKHALTVDYFRILDFYGKCKPSAWRDGENWYIERHSIAMALPHLFVHAYNQRQEEKLNAYISFTEAEERFLGRETAEVSGDAIRGHLVVLLVESLESWAMEARDASGREVTPCLNAFASGDGVLVARNVVCQKRYGESGDGQLIINSGLLPVKEGVACMKYANRTYPNYAHLFPGSVLVNPVKNTWNQAVMTGRYGYKRLVEPAGVTMKESWNDAQVMDITRTVCDTLRKPSCVMALTISSHTPFDRVEPTLNLAGDLSQERNRYLQCIHYADSCVGVFLRWADTAECMCGATIVVTGDHNIFPGGVCPLLMKSPSIDARKMVEEKCYQMDIYPTILHAIGQQGYAWKGFGVDLLEDGSSAARPIDVESAYELSDKLIRKNYFAK